MTPSLPISQDVGAVQAADDGGAAFPTANSQFFGMSLRDYFAAKAMAAYIAKYGFELEDGDEESLDDFDLMLAKNAYETADAMIRARATGAQP